MSLGNLRAIANANSGNVVNPNVPGVLKISDGYTTNAAHKQVPSYIESAVQVQVQPASSGDIKHLDALNVQGVDKVAYVNGQASAIIRIKQKGGDLLVFEDGVIPEGNVWLVVASLEQWGGVWAKVAIKLQDQSS